MESKEKRIKSITKIYYSNPKIQKTLLDFGENREVVPSYMMNSFGKRPDSLQYPSDILNLVNKGATSFHASEEIWKDPLQINSDMSRSEQDGLRKGWDLLIDIDSPFLDYSKIAARLILDELEREGVKSYGLKFSGSKGFHILVPFSAFPEMFNEIPTNKMFPDWPRAICQYILYKIRSKYNKEVTKLGINFTALKERTNLSKEDVVEIVCPNCGSQAKKTNLVTFKCDRCESAHIRPNYKITKRKLRCIQDDCPGLYEIVSEQDYFFCENCKAKHSINENQALKNTKYKTTTTYSREAKSSVSAENFQEQISGEKIASLDLVLVAPRHLFRMPYSLHEKTALASIVLEKNQLEDFSPRDANPMKVEIKDFIPQNVTKDEALGLLSRAVEWKALQTDKEEKELSKKYTSFEKIDLRDVPEGFFPQPIKKLLKGLEEGRKRGLFVLLTFLRSLNFSPKYINSKIREWNKLNEPPLKEGYIKSQIDWHLKQKRQILPPNYANDSFYKDLNLFSEGKKPSAKNPIAEVARKMKKQKVN